MLHLDLISDTPIYFAFLRGHQCSSLVVTVFWGFSSVLSRKSRFLTTLIGNTELLSTLFRGNGPHLAARGKFHEFSRVAAGTWCIVSSYGEDGHLKLGFVQRSQDSCLVMTDTSGS